MKMISKIAKVALGLVLVGSSVFAQSLDDAKKAIDAEQYQKAKSMLKNLTVTQATNADNFFYLGWVYLIQEYPDSAKEQFTKGLAANPKSGLNYVGLGAVAHLTGDAAGVTANFNKAIDVSSKKDSRMMMYMGDAYLLLPPGAKTVSVNDYTAAVAILNKGKLANPKDAELLVVLGNAERSQKHSTDAYTAYTDAQTLNPKLLTAIVAQGVSLEAAQNFEDAEEQFKKAIAIDANFGPAYREWAETDLYWAQTVRTTNGPVASQKVKDAVDHYKKYLSLTDNSTETLLRYALFLYNAGDFETLQSVAATLSKAANSNALVYRYIGYSAFHNKDYQNGISAMNTWFSKASPERILPSDYLVLGRLLIASGQDTVKGVATLKKYAELDTTKTEEIYNEIRLMYYTKKNYSEALKTVQEEVSKIHGRPLLTEHYNIGYYGYLTFQGQSRAARTNPSIKPDSSLLTIADSALSYVQKGNPNPIYQTALFRARIADYKDIDIQHLKGLAKPHYERLVQLLIAKDSTKWTQQEKNYVADAYAYEGNYALYHDNDPVKADEWYTKDKALNPTEYYQDIYFKNKDAKAANDAAIKAAEEKKNAKKGAGGPASKPQQEE